MKKTLSILLVALLAISSVIGVSAATRFISNDTGATFDQIQTSVFASKKTNEFPDVTGTWKHENKPEGCSVQVFNQDGNKIDFMIESTNESHSKISTAKASVELNVWDDGTVVRGESEFEVTDSFGNTGKGTILVSENVIKIIFDEFNNVNAWSVGNTSGDYIFASKTVNPTL